MRGLQGTDLKDPLRVLACAKHYVGDGGTAWNTAPHLAAQGARLDQGDTRLSEAELRRIHLAGYRGGDRGRRGLDHALLQQLERRDGLGEQAAAHRHPEGRAGLRRAS